MFRWLILLIGIILIEYYSYQAIYTLTKKRSVLLLYVIFNLLVMSYIIYQLTQFDRSVGQTKQTLFIIGLFLLFVIPKMTITTILFIEDISRFLRAVATYFVGTHHRGNFIPTRRRFVSQIALGLAAIPFTSLLYGMTIGKYNFKVIRQTIYFPDLPEEFDGFKITQISDIHSGSFDNHEKIDYAINLINTQDSDMILFTGDIVNTHAKEMFPWIATFNKIKTHRYGKYAVLGNHDYGEYVTWKTKDEKAANFNAIKNLYGQIDFKLLLNEHTIISKGDQKIVLVGVENWGHNFKKAGDLNKASEGLANEDFKILMSHDPSHWNYEVQHHEKNFQLTLSGHTHGMQFGIEILGYFKWSLAQYMYKQWAGLYQNKSRYLYVNRGFGFHAYPGRVGIMPEITVIELKKSKNIV